MIKVKKPRNHITQDEIMYIDNIGKHHKETSRLEPMVVLKNYIEAAMKRNHWDSLDKVAIITHAQLKYAQMQ